MTAGEVSRSRGSERRRDRRSEVWGDALGSALLFGVGCFLLLGFFMGLDYFSVRGHPTEQAVVLSVEPSGTKETCGRAFSPNTPGERTTYRSLNPPRGFPAEFSVSHCPDSDEVVGDEVPIRRTGLSQDDVYVDPIETVGDWLGMAAVIAVPVAIGAFVFTALKSLWSIRRSERRRGRPTAPA